MEGIRGRIVKRIWKKEWKGENDIILLQLKHLKVSITYIFILKMFVQSFVF